MCFRYCNWDDANTGDSSAAQVQGRQYVEEDIRRLCLWHMLKEENVKGDGQRPSQEAWWAYIMAFQRSCSSQSGQYNAECSQKVRHKLAHMTYSVKGASNLPFMNPSMRQSDGGCSIARRNDVYPV